MTRVGRDQDQTVIQNAPWDEFTPRSSTNNAPQALLRGSIVVFVLEAEHQYMKKPPTVMVEGLFIQCG